MIWSHERSKCMAVPASSVEEAQTGCHTHVVSPGDGEGMVEAWKGWMRLTSCTFVVLASPTNERPERNLPRPLSPAEPAWPLASGFPPCAPLLFPALFTRTASSPTDNFFPLPSTHAHRPPPTTHHTPRSTHLSPTAHTDDSLTFVFVPEILDSDLSISCSNLPDLLLPLL